MKIDQIQIDYLLSFNAPFHCGTGTRIGLIDRSVVRDGNGYLYVPGSTFKGVLRERCEQLERVYEQNEQRKQVVESPHDGRQALRGFGQQVTMVTRIFGSQICPGRLFFDDARQTETSKGLYESQGDDEGKYRGLQTAVYTQVRLDRLTRTAVRGALYTSEFGTTDMLFQGSITGWLECTAINLSALENGQKPDDIPTYSLLLLLAGLQMIERLGGNKSTGKGKCNCEVTKVMVNENELEWKSWLGQVNALVDYHKVS